MKTTEKLLQDIDMFIAKNGISAHQFGLQATKNHKIVKNLRNGLGISNKNIDRIYDFIGSYNNN